MAVENLGNGQFKIGGKVVDSPTAEEQALRDKAAMSSSELSGYLQGTMHATVFRQVRASIENSESEWLRLHLLDADKALAEIASNVDLVGTLSRAKEAASDVDLVEDARRRKATLVLQLLLDKVHAKHQAVISMAMMDMVAAMDLVKAALAPEVSSNEQVRELREIEVRRIVFEADKSDRAAMVLGLGERAALEGIKAVERCPVGLSVEPAILAQAKRTALEKMGVDFLITQITDRRDVLLLLSVRCDMIEGAIRDFLKAYNMIPKAPMPWVRTTDSAIKASGEVLS